MRCEAPAEENIGFQLAPMIDMTFLLLVFFMVTTRISKEQIKVDIHLPVASNAVFPSDVSNRDIISIDEAGAYFIGDRAATRKELEQHLRRRFEVTPPLKLYVRADHRTAAKQIKDLMALAADVGAVNVIFGTHRDDG